MNYLPLLILIISFTITFGQTDVNLNGLWADSTNESTKNAYAIISQIGDKIKFSHYLEFNGKPFVEFGEGSIMARTITYRVDVSLPIPGWSLAGVHVLTLSKDGKTLRGSYFDNKGNSGILVFKRK